MASPTVPFLLIFITAVLLLTPSSSLTSQTSNVFSSNKPPRFLGKHSHGIKPNHQQYRYETRFFSQPLDHFSFLDLPRFRQRYLINTDHWVGPSRFGPIFLYCGNEDDIELFAANTGFVWDIAPRFGAIILFPEHRYYGESMPFRSREEAYRNATTLSYLTAEQALADFAFLITDLKKNLSAEGCPVVLFCGSYGGMLAAWMRLKYPHIAVGASAPILQFEDIVSPETFYNIVSNSFKELKSVQDLTDWLDSAYSYLAMVNYPYPANFIMPLPAHPVREVCRKIDGSPPDSSILERIFNGVTVFYNYTGDVDCFQLDDDPHGIDEWDWQACTEMVMPMGSDRNTRMFPAYDWDYSAFREGCKRDFQVTPRPRWITTEFGGHGIEHALKFFGRNIVFPNGLLDPWSGGSALKNISETIVALVTQEVLVARSKRRSACM